MIEIAAVDSETTGTDFFHGCRPFKFMACDGEVNYSWDGQVNPYTREVFWDDNVKSDLVDFLHSCRKIVFHNTQFDMRALDSIGVYISSFWDKIEDTLLSSHCICSGDEHGLKFLLWKYMGWFPSNEKLLEAAVKAERPAAKARGWRIAKHGDPMFPGMPKNSEFWKQDFWLCPEECELYGFDDVEGTLILWKEFEAALQEDNLWDVYQVRKKLLRICYNITTEGMDLYMSEVLEYIKDLEQKMRQYRKELTDTLKTYYTFNWNKKDHLRGLLLKAEIPIIFYTESGAVKTDKEALKYYYKNYEHPALELLMQAKKTETEYKYIKSYYNWADDQGRIHSNLNITGTRETRQSSSSPNQQNITSRLAKLFGPPPGTVWAEFDFANIELRFWAYKCGNQQLIEAFERGESVHMLIFHTLYPTEAAMYEKDPENETLKIIYRNIKAGNFANIYGATEKKVDQTYGYVGAYKKVIARFPEIKQFSDWCIEQQELHRIRWMTNSVTTMGGYRLDVPPEEPFKGSNYWVQGSAGLKTTYAMIEVEKDPEYVANNCKMNNQTHDSLKIKIPIHQSIKRTIYSISETMACAGKEHFGVCPVSWKLIVNPADKDLEILKGIMRG